MPGLHNDRLWLSIPAIHTAPDQVLPVWSVRALNSELSPLSDMQAKSYLTVDGNLTGIAR